MTIDTKERIKAAMMLVVLAIVVIVVFLMVLPGCHSSTKSIDSQARMATAEAKAIEAEAAQTSQVLEEVSAIGGEPFLGTDGSGLGLDPQHSVTRPEDWWRGFEDQNGVGGGRGQGSAVVQGAQGSGLDRGGRGAGVSTDLLRQGDSSDPGVSGLVDPEGGPERGPDDPQDSGRVDGLPSVRGGPAGEGSLLRGGLSEGSPGSDRSACSRCAGWRWFQWPAFAFALSSGGLVGFVVRGLLK